MLYRHWNKSAAAMLSHQGYHIRKQARRTLIEHGTRPKHCYLVAPRYSSSLKSQKRGFPYKVWQFSSSENEESKDRTVLYQSVGETSQKWKETNNTFDEDEKFDVKKVSRQMVSHFLPAQYATRVAPGYLPFAGYCFIASVAGSASMVLSTQTLLLAVGVVGSNVQQAGIMAGAFNWVMKDFVGQLGGVLFASQMGKTRAFDADPKRYRMFSAMTLDAATLLEILSPLFHSTMVLPVASIANVGKNIGFLTASASRAAIHQSLAISGNLGDVTAKAGSQSIMASLVGTTLGIGLSSILAHDTYKFSLGFCFLAATHQGFNYLSLRNVPLAHLNRQRLSLLLDNYLTTDVVLSPAEVAEKEAFLPLLSGDTNVWLKIGSPLTEVAPDPSQFDSILESTPDESYVLHRTPETTHLVFLQNSSGEDMIQALLHAFRLQKLLAASNESSIFVDHAVAVKDTHNETITELPGLLDQLHEKGWKTTTESVSIESSKSYRFLIDQIDEP